jgi:hypothetical protein
VIPELEHHQLENAVDEIELLGFPLSSPFQLVPSLPENTIAALDIPRYKGQKVRLCGYLIHVKNLSTRAQVSQHMMFGTFLDEAGQFIDTVHFPQSAAQYRFKGKGIYLIEGIVIEEYDFYSVEVLYLERLPYVNFEDV